MIQISRRRLVHFAQAVAALAVNRQVRAAAVLAALLLAERPLLVDVDARVAPTERERPQRWRRRHPRK